MLLATALPELPPIVQAAPPAQQSILERIMAEAPAGAIERSFGACNYAWGAQWKLSSDGIRTTMRHCRGEASPSPFAVSCSTLKVNTAALATDKKALEWGQWRSPVAPGAQPGEAMAVASLCANVSR